MVILNRTLNPITREERNKVNENWDTLERTYNDLVEISTISRELIDESQQNAAQALQQSDQAINTANNVQSQLDTIVSQPQTNEEVVQARVDYTSLRERLDTEFAEVNNEVERIKEKLSGIIFVDAYRDRVVDNDWSPAIQYIVDNMESGTILLPNETFEIKSQVSINKSNITVEGQPNTVVVNNSNEPLNTPNALFRSAGNYEQVTRLSQAYNSDVLEMVVNDVSNIQIGDYVGFKLDYDAQQILKVNFVNTGTRTITFDRPTFFSMPIDTEVFKYTPVHDVTFKNIKFDMNNQYSYGIYVRAGYNIKIENIYGVKNSSIFVQYDRCVDSSMFDIECREATATNIAGNGYVMRLSNCNDCRLENIRGTRVRHVVDLSNSSRNMVIACDGKFNGGTDFLTHMNNSVRNKFTGCNSLNNPIAAYSFLPVGDSEYQGGDVENIVQGGFITNSPILYYPQNGTNLIKGVNITSNKLYNLFQGGTLVIEDCTITCNSPLFHSVNVDWDLTFRNCRLIVNVANGLGSMPNTTGQINVTFENCTIETYVTGNVLLLPVNSTLKLLNSHIIAQDNDQNFGVFTTNGKVIATNNTFEFRNSGVSFISLLPNSNLNIDNNTFINASQVFRIQNTRQSDAVIGKNNLINSNYPNINTLRNITTTYPLDLKRTVIPDFDNFTLGSTISNYLLTAGDFEYWVYTSTGWKASPTLV